MVAALYLRVSTDMQALEGFSISAQNNLLVEYCRKNAIKIFKVYVDEGISGQEEQRPQFQQMLKDAESKQFDIILVHKFDRFARRVELSQRIKRQLRKAGVNVISITEPIEDSPIGFFQEGILELLSEYYVRNLAQESKKGHVERAKQGNHNGSVPYGYRIDKETGLMIIRPEQAEVIRYIFDQYNNQGIGSTKIALLLNQAGVPTAVKGTWNHYTVNYILRNEKYIGKIYYDGKVYEGKHEPIIPEETFYLTQKFMKDRTWKREPRGSNYPKFLLLGFLRCAECNAVFRIMQDPSNHKRQLSRFYYVCNNISHYNPNKTCSHNKHYASVTLEAKILEKIEAYTKGVDIGSTTARLDKGIDFKANRTDKIKVELSRAKEAYLRGVFELKEYSDIKKKLESELSDLLNAPVTDTSSMTNEVKTLWEQFGVCQTIPEKKAVLKKFLKCVYVSPESLYFKFEL